MTIGFACAWDRDWQRTFSHTPWSLRAALLRRTDTSLVDLPARLPFGMKRALQALLVHRYRGRFVSDWRISPTTYAWYQRSILSTERSHPEIQAILEYGDVGIGKHPTFIYQDLAMQRVVDSWDSDGSTRLQFGHYDLDRVKRRAAQHTERCSRAAGVITMSAWDAEYMIARGIASRDRVHVVPPGLNIPHEPLRERKRDEHAPKRILFIGRDFHRKAGPLVVDAFLRARAASDLQMELTITGPASWPLQGAIPDGIRFLGDIPLTDVRKELHETDLFVMPSRFEAFGIVFIEALSMGVPVIGRRAFAMPEFIEHERNGYLLDSDDPDALAALIDAGLHNEVMREHVRQNADLIAQRYSWDAAAERMVSIMRA